MEVTIPPRDHETSTYQYTWDENGEVIQINRVPNHQSVQPPQSQPSPQPPQPPQPSQLPPPPQQPLKTKRSRYGRQTVQWPFQSIATIETSISNQLLFDQAFTFTTAPMPIRPATWEPKRMLPALRRRRGSGWWDSDTESDDVDLVPDYVINYIRGETPETVARRKMNGGKLGERGVDLVTVARHQPHQSRTAQFEGFYDDRTSASTVRHEAGSEMERRTRVAGSGSDDGDAEDSHILSGYGDEKARPDKGWRRLVVGWRGGVALNLVLACLMLVIGIVCVILAVSNGSSSPGEVALYTGSCSAADHVNWGLHAIVNVFGIVLLAGANYAFQVLSSPTRQEVDAAHGSRRWLHVGVPSLRNFVHIGKSRAALLVGIMMVTLATQVIYNAVIFTSRTATGPGLVSGTQSLPTGASFSNICSVNIHTSLLGVASLLNLLTAIVLAFLLFKPSFEPLVSLGDAVSSFLQRPDDTTTQSCLMTKPDASKSRWLYFSSQEGKYWTPKNYLWLSIPSVPQWGVFLLSWAIPAALAATALVITVRSETGRLSTFGTVSRQSLYTGSLSTPYAQAGFSVAICLPQLLVAFLYLATNGVLTTYHLSHESARFTLGHPHPLRVTSSPQGSQTTSLYLTLPRPWSWFLVVLFIAISFVLSQAVFPVSIRLTGSETRLTAAGLSGTALVALLSLLAFLLAVILGLGLRRPGRVILADGQVVGNPLVLQGGSCSAVLSAWCHPEAWEKEVWMREVTWGVVRQGNGGSPSHCAFTAGRAGQMQRGRAYA